MSRAVTIKDKLVSDIDGFSSVYIAYNYEKLNPKGFPAVFVTLQGIEGEFETNAENSRVYTYRALAIYPIGKSVDTATQEAINKADGALSDVLDQIIDGIDSEYTLDGTIDVLFVEALDSDFGYVEYEGGWARSAQIVIKVHTDYLVSDTINPEDYITSESGDPLLTED